MGIAETLSSFSFQTYPQDDFVRVIRGDYRKAKNVFVKK
jgi:hypothetical protein